MSGLSLVRGSVPAGLCTSQSAWISSILVDSAEALRLFTGERESPLSLSLSLSLSLTPRPCDQPLFSAAGISRSVTITVVYMMTVSEHGFEACLTAVRACREIANPNCGFRMQLKQYEEGKMKEVSHPPGHRERLLCPSRCRRGRGF